MKLKTPKLILIIGCIAALLIVLSLPDFLSAYQYESNLYSGWTSQSEYIKNNSNQNLTINYSDSAYSYSVNIYSDSLPSPAIDVSTIPGLLPIKLEGCQNIKVYFNKKINVGLSRFIPLYKKTKFDSDFQVKWSGQIMNGDENITIAKEGEFMINGNFMIYGICSARKTKEIIQKSIVKEARKLIS